MQATQSIPRRAPRQSIASQGNAIWRASRYLWNYSGQAFLPYIFLLVATLSQLAVPRLIRNIIDAVTQGVIATQVLNALDKIPAAVMTGTAEDTRIFEI